MADTAELKQRRTLYFDYQATTPVDPGVVAAMLPFFSDQFGNAGSRHSHGTAAALHVAAAREQIAQLIGALSPDEIIFTAGATESNAITIRKIFAAAERNHFITTAIEHPSVLGPAAELVRAGHEVSYLAVNCQGRVDPVQVESLIRPETRLVSVMHANNEVGTIQPLADIGRITRAAGVLLHADLTQTAGALEVDVQDLGVDLASFSAHKFYGPKGIGALYVRSGCSLGKEPGRTESALRPGTMNVPGIVGMGAAAVLAVERRGVDMIEVPRIALNAAELATHADFLSIGSNDLTQFTLAVSRDDAEVGFLSAYVRDQVIAADPFECLDREGVGRILRICIDEARSSRPDLPIGLCGEHASDPASVEYLVALGLDYLSCSPRQVPLARFSAGRATLMRSAVSPD